MRIPVMEQFEVCIIPVRVIPPLSELTIRLPCTIKQAFEYAWHMEGIIDHEGEPARVVDVRQHKGEYEVILELMFPKLPPEACYPVRVPPVLLFCAGALILTAIAILVL